MTSRCAEVARATTVRINSMQQTLHTVQDSDLNGVVAIRYTGGARMLLLIELGRRKNKMRIKVSS